MPSCEVVLKPLDGKVNFVSLPTAKRNVRVLAPLKIGAWLNLLVFCIMRFANDRASMVKICPLVIAYSFLMEISPSYRRWHIGIVTTLYILAV